MTNEGMPQIMIDFIKLVEKLSLKENNRQNIGLNQRVQYLKEELEILSSAEYFFQIINRDKKSFLNDLDEFKKNQFITILETNKKFFSIGIFSKKSAFRRDLEKEIELLRKRKSSIRKESDFNTSTYYKLQQSHR